MKKEYGLKKDILIAIILIICISLFILISGVIRKHEYNNGVCGCGGRLIYQQAIGHNYTTSYIFKCDKCNNIFEFNKSAIKNSTIYYEDGTSTNVYNTSSDTDKKDD
jgi:hypothetical protein